MAGNSALTSISNAIADAVDGAAASVVQVHGRRRPASGVVYSNGVVVTMARSLGREDGLHVTQPDGSPGCGARWLGSGNESCCPPGAGLTAPPLNSLQAGRRRVGHLAVAIARSWSNGVTASVGNVAMIGGPLATGRRRAIEQVIRTTARCTKGLPAARS